MKKKQTILDKWVDHNWLYANFILGVIMFVLLIWQWNVWEVPQRLICILAILVPIHNFEEYLFPGGFYFMNNIVGGSDDPLLYPQNKFMTIITNNGAELLLVIYTLLAPQFETAVVIVAMAFGYLETIVHIIFGAAIWRRYKDIDKKSIYAPGLFTCITVLTGLSTISLKWLSTQTLATTDIVIGIVFLLIILIGLLLIPLAVFSKLRQERFRLEGLGYFEKYEQELVKYQTAKKN
ncbi:HXXEE domain-containing protein [Anaerovorax odorimutans]|uniref:HXXEE domain-containing protein n=1 Tax=Anaerovorax odorimutans TaxID=109327 RepID=A0ABT1RTS0_9FIRM|nr:HXXEE domain-containing protein [Anaerovorax odorimutans]MCQ4638609.1 HXXEE domain-containing protein [Anaerovorax odorimutans]